MNRTRSTLTMNLVEEQKGSIAGEDVGASQFGGCAKLLGQYQMIGKALLSLEADKAQLSRNALRSNQSFQQSVAFIPVEVLVSYLDDLLDPEISQDNLFLKREKRFYFPFVISLLALGLCLLIFSKLLVGKLLVLVFSSTVLIGAAFVAYWYLSQNSAARRLFFARALSKEIARRKGSGDGPEAFEGPSLSLKDLFQARPRSIQGAAREIVLLH